MNKDCEVPKIEKLTPETIRYEYYSGSSQDDPERYLEYCVGYAGVTEIREHAAQGDGDRWYWDVHFDNNQVQRIFNPHMVFYAKTFESVVPTEYPRIDTTTKSIVP
jgi:hypothetical protein